MKRVAAINDLSGFGKCSLIADISVLSSMGIEVCPVPTAVLTAQTGFPSYYQQDLKDMVEHCRIEWSRMGTKFDGIITGYIPHENQIDQIIDFANAFNQKNTVLLVDPVMGDGGQCYANYTDSMRLGIQKLVRKADVITPNLTELCILAGEDPTELPNNVDRILEIAKKAKANEKQKIVVTGVSLEKGELCNIAIYPGGAEVIHSKYNGLSYSGTGDLFAAALMGNLLNGETLVDAVSKTADFISESIVNTEDKDRNYGVDYELQLKKGWER